MDASNKREFFPIAIVGIGCRLPGGVSSADDFWEIIRDGKDVITEVPPDRWSLDNFYHPDPSKQGKMITRRGGFIEGIDKFDNGFFKISPREACSMDPQHRILLEVVHEAFEDAGILSDTLGVTAGVYVAIGMPDYGGQTLPESSLINPYTLTGISYSTAANRISYAFDLKGPSFSVDTACASSLTAMHLACSGLWNGECETAIVAGCNALILPETSVAFSALGALSKDGKCCPFSNTAEGYVRSEGWGALVLKPLQKAKQDGDHIYALIRGIAIAANGSSSSLTKPSIAAQTYVMEQAYKRFGVSLSDVHYIEAHGTGTPVGDPAEAEAIGKTFGPYRDTPLKFGSAKGNFGHSECSSGVTAVIKVALMLKNKTLCPTVNFEQINPNIRVDDWMLQVQTQLEKLPNTSSQKKAIIGLNSFGFGGAVAHMILEEASEHILQGDALSKSSGWSFGDNGTTGSTIIVPLSAQSRQALDDVARQWREFQNERDAYQIVSWLSTRRKHHVSRLAVISNSGEGFRQQIDQFLDTGSGSDMAVGDQSRKPNVCFVFPGQGQQWRRMGQQLFQKESVFRESVHQCDSIFRELSGWSLLNDKKVFISDNSEETENVSSGLDNIMSDTSVTQPAILFFQVGLLHLLRHWEIFPDVVVGHSLGEVAAAYACGGITLDEAVRAIYHRSHQQANLKGSGAMAALRMSLPEAKDLCQTYDDLYVAAINAPFSITIAGKTDVIEQVTVNNPTIAKRLRVECAFHTPFMDTMRTPFHSVMEGVIKTDPGSNSVPFYSTVTGKLYNGGFGTDYWWGNIRGNVNFQLAVEEILNNVEVDVFLEISASTTLLSSVNQICNQFNMEVTPKRISTGLREQDDYLTVVRALANLYVAGCSINWKHVMSNSSPWIRLPTYPWQHQSFWLETDERRKRRLGLDDRTFKGKGGNISLETFPFLADHIVQDRLVFPGAGFAEMMVQSVFSETECPTLSNVSFKKLLTWPQTNDGTTKPLSLQCHRAGSNVEITWDGTSYASAKLGAPPRFEETLPLDTIRSRCETHVTGSVIYDRMDDLGLQYGTSFQVINEAAVGDGEIVGFFVPMQIDYRQRMQVTLLDGCIQLLLFISGSTTNLYLPVSIESIQMNEASMPTAESLLAFAEVTDMDSQMLIGDIIIATSTGRTVLKVQGCRCQNITKTKTDVSPETCFYTTRMQPLQSCLPDTSLCAKWFEKDCLQERFTDEMKYVLKAEHLLPRLEAACMSYIHNGSSPVDEEVEKNQKIQLLKTLKQNSGKNLIEEVKNEDVEITMDQIKTNLRELQDEIALLQRTPHIQPAKGLGLPNLVERSLILIDSSLTRLLFVVCAEMINAAVRTALEKKHIVRILDVDSEQGSVATYVLPLLKDVCEDNLVEYIVSFSGSYPQHQFYEFPFVKYQKFDISKDLVSQGMVPSSVDIIICTGDVTLCTNLKNCLTNVQKLLSERGWFLACAPTKFGGTSDVLFGDMQRIGCFSDFKQESCCLTKDRFIDVLKTTGFKDLDVLSVSQMFPHSIFVCSKAAQASKKTSQTSISSSHPSFFIVTDQNAADGSTLTSVICEKLGPAVKIIKEDDSVKLLSLNADTHNSSLIYIPSPESHLFKLTKLLQMIGSKSVRIKRVFAVLSGTKTGTALAAGFIRSVTNGIQTPIYAIHLKDTKLNTIESLVAILRRREVVREREITVREGDVTVPRIVKVKLNDNRNGGDGGQWALATDQKLDSRNASVDNLGFQLLNDLVPLPGKVVVRVKYSGLNFKDVMITLGLLDGLTNDGDALYLGLECSGTIDKVGDEVTSFNVGDDVMGFGERCFASHTICDAELLVHKPPGIDLAEAAGICIVFCTAYYSLIKRANLQREDTVLIHSACGGVGLAAIQVARMVGARVICSAGTEQKRSYLRNELGVEMVTDSRSSRFYDDVMAWTGGAGVDVVLNSLYGDKLTKGIQALAPGGRFCEIGKRDILESSLQMHMLLENKSFMSCQLDRMIQRQKHKVRQLLVEVISLFGDNGPFAPVPTMQCPIENHRDTFTMMAKGNHIGKLVFSIPANFKPPTLLPSSYVFDNNATYIITGGYGGLGLALARWFCKKGVRYMALVSRCGCKSHAARRTVQYMRNKGATVFDFALDVSMEKDVKALVDDLEQVYKAPAVKGIFHLAGSITEESLGTLTPEILNQIVEAKATGARHLHNLTQHMPLEIFFLMSTSITMWGHSSQPCYSAANAYLDGLAEERREQGLPAISVQLGPVRGAGFLEYNTNIADMLDVKGCGSLHIDEVLEMLGYILQARNTPAVLSLVNQDWSRTLRFCYRDNLRFRHLTQPVRPRRSVSVFASYKKLAEDRLREKIGRLLCVDPQTIDLQQPMVNYGVDSLMAVEMVTWASKDMNTSITQVEVLGGLTSDAFLKKVMTSLTGKF